MIPWELLGSSPTPDGSGTMTLRRRGQEYSVCIGRWELMNSRLHGSEEALARLAAEALVSATPSQRGSSPASVLVGGLGMGFTLAAALRAFPAPARIAVGELMEVIVDWNEGPLGHLAGHPLKDERVTLQQGDILKLIAGCKGTYDAILLDIDNGPDGLTQASNEWLYGRSGLATLSAALRVGGVLTVWSATDDAGFTRRLRSAGFAATTHRVRARSSGKGGRHIIWVAIKPIEGRGGR